MFFFNVYHCKKLFNRNVNDMLTRDTAIVVKIGSNRISGLIDSNEDAQRGIVQLLTPS